MVIIHQIENGWYIVFCRLGCVAFLCVISVVWSLSGILLSILSHHIKELGKQVLKLTVGLYAPVCKLYILLQFHKLLGLFMKTNLKLAMIDFVTVKWAYLTEVNVEI